ncbi:ABC transporter substrate-binding protein [Oceanobacillus jeddahense]|uniref:ABC transporter substrate-binding protein n=1 Tax=Oceanobacillus jeddahense TaxID=1462527 RepID=A0ABY5JQJ2_9BACI|nr:ABC transporter substrate-binding protein [Oceanobacillus jeddahense]UUI02585.1 ABC transporter substrate-binding protein [Oceanobacillus jeddahense]
MKKLLFTLMTVSVFVLSACGDSSSEEIDTIVFADAGWDSINVHNYIAAQILEEGYGYDTDITSGSTAATVQGLGDGDINVYMEVWTDNIRDIYEELTEAGDIETLSVNFDDNDQGLYVPAYVVEGDPERGIDPLAPDLKTVEDLKNYPEVFEDPEDPEKGRIINAPSGWAVEEAINEKFDFYELEEDFNNFSPGSDSAIITDLARAYEAGEGWVGYYWSPTAITAKYDLILLEEEPYDEEVWEETKGTEFPPNDVVISVHKDFPEQAPEVVEFLEQYETSSALTEDALEYMEDSGASTQEAAIWWMQEHEDVWTEWIPEDIAEDVLASLE